MIKDNIYKISEKIYASKYAMDELNDLCIEFEEFNREEKKQGIKDTSKYPRKTIIDCCHYDIMTNNPSRNFVKDAKLCWVIKKDYIYVYKDGLHIRDNIIPYLPDYAADFPKIMNGSYEKFRLINYTKNFDEELWL